VELYSNLSKPLLDMAVYTYKLSHTIGLQGPGTMLGYLALSGVVLTWLRRYVCCLRCRDVCGGYAATPTTSHR
jgi:hypothetical protein